VSQRGGTFVDVEIGVSVTHETTSSDMLVVLALVLVGSWCCVVLADSHGV